MVIIDSDVWSEAFRQKPKNHSPQAKALYSLIANEEVLLIGAIRQEVLSGLRIKKDYDGIKKALRSWKDEEIETSIYELAASFSNHCRSKGVQGSHSDFLICACSAIWNASILSKDNDYKHFEEHIPINLYKIEAEL